MSPISPRNILRHELIGLKANVINSTNPSHCAVEGFIVDESMKTLVIEQDGVSKRVPKRDATFIIKLPSGLVEIKGAALYGRPEDRVKKKIKRRW
ncbi:MAG: ribonuclease P protein component 1 [Candidatus Bathyarchaeia archaeon]